jgi:hypothetical protein
MSGISFSLFTLFLFWGGEGGRYKALWTNLQKARNVFFSFLFFFLKKKVESLLVLAMVLARGGIKENK